MKWIKSQEAIVFSINVGNTYQILIYLSIFQLKPYAPTLFHLEEVKKILEKINDNFPFISYFFRILINTPKFCLIPPLPPSPFGYSALKTHKCRGYFLWDEAVDDEWGVWLVGWVTTKYGVEIWINNADDLLWLIQVKEQQLQIICDITHHLLHNSIHGILCYISFTYYCSGQNIKSLYLQEGKVIDRADH